MERLRGKALYLKLIKDQQKWIECCEGQGSYSGKNGVAIRRADMDELKRLEWLARIARQYAQVDEKCLYVYMKCGGNL